MTVTRLYLIAVLASAACASGTGGSGVPTPPRRTSTVLTLEEITDAHLEGGSVYDAISRLRPRWLTRSTRSYSTQSETFATVFVEGQRYGEIEALRNLDVGQIAGVRYYSPAESAKFGIESGLTGVIEVSLRKK
ncbi:MAG TPA: hypothetical protein VFP77_06990 [Gemmatimonadaceae bacterium]|jgi:hypothetical protein|nr:hypothetical protein [Gemmatimonadaceae bacterium]